MPSKTNSKKNGKALTLKQAQAEVEKHAPEYRAYVAAQIERKDAKTKKDTDAAQRKMDSHRKGYTAYRNAYRAFKAQGGTLRKAVTAKPAASKGKTQSAAKRNTGKGKGSKTVKTTKLSKAAMSRRGKDNPLGLTDEQLKAEADGAPLAQPLGEVVRQG